MLQFLNTAALFTLIALVALRPLVAETYDTGEGPFAQALAGLADATPIRTVILDLVIILATGAWTVARAVGRTQRAAYRWTGLEWGALLILLASVISCVAAGNKRLAMNASIDWLCLPLLAITLVQLLDRPWKRRMLVAAILASAVVQAASCYEYYFVGYHETIAEYESRREAFWEAQNVPLDSPRVAAFERRLAAREAGGFFPHSNIAGSYLVLCGLAGLGLTVGAWRHRRDAGMVIAAGAALISALILAAVSLTGSLGAAVSGFVALALWVGVALAGRRLRLYRRKALIAGWTAVGFFGIAVVVYGTYRGHLVLWSLTFRWQYWTASAEPIADYGWTGVGRENFGRHYLQYKWIVSPEEVSNPHNLFVHAAAEWGYLGLIGVGLMLIGASIVLTRSSAVPLLPVGRSPPSARTQPAAANAPTVLRWIVALTAVVAIARLPLLGSQNIFYLYYAAVSVAILWPIGCTVYALAGRAIERGGDALRSSVAGVSLGLLAFVLHDMINFALFVPGAATTAFAAMAFAVSCKYTDEPVPLRCHTWRRWLPAAGIAAAVAVVLTFALIPMAASRIALREAEVAGATLEAGPLSDQPAYRSFETAAAADPFDPVPLAREARWLAGVAAISSASPQAWSLAAAALERAIQRDPYSLRLVRLKMRVHTAQARATQSMPAYQAAIEAAQRALELYPQSPTGFVDLADREAEVAGFIHDGPEGVAIPEAHAMTATLLRQAIAHYEHALVLDDQRLEWEELHRLTESRRREIREKIASARTQLSRLP